MTSRQVTVASPDWMRDLQGVSLTFPQWFLFWPTSGQKGPPSLPGIDRRDAHGMLGFCGTSGDPCLALIWLGV